LWFSTVRRLMPSPSDLPGRASGADQPEHLQLPAHELGAVVFPSTSGHDNRYQFSERL
jgi:hypothetical protein